MTAEDMLRDLERGSRNGGYSITWKSGLLALLRELIALRAKPAAMDGDVEARIAEIKAREAKATPEPIKKVRYDHGGGRAYVEPDRDLIMDCYGCEADREFYFHCRADIPYLVAQVESLRAEIARRDAGKVASPAPDAEGKR